MVRYAHTTKLIILISVNLIGINEEQVNERIQRGSISNGKGADVKNISESASRGAETTSRNSSKDTGNEIPSRNRETVPSSETVPIEPNQASPQSLLDNHPPKH